jgi:hypothetical protein
MSFIEDKRIFYINSDHRLSGDHSDFTYKFDIPPNKFTHVVCLDLFIPKSYYLIQSPRNKFTLKEDDKEVSIEVKEGNYSSIEFTKYLTQELNDKSPNHFTYTVRHNKQQGKYEFEVKNNSDVQPSIIVTNSLYEQLGFDLNSENKFVDNKLTSKNVISFSRESTLFLRSDITSQGYGDNVLQQVFTQDTDDFSNIVYNCQNVDAYSKKLNSTFSNSYRFWLTNENGESINTNGRNIVFTLMLFKKTPINQNLTNYMKYVSSFINDLRNKRI